MIKHNPDLLMCRKRTGIQYGKVCDYCSQKCILCESNVNLERKVRICEDCNFGFFGQCCVICNQQGTEFAYYCYNCCLLEKDREGCPKIINISASRKDRHYIKKKYISQNNSQLINE